MSEWRALTKARKNHWCEICRDQIAKGELYVRYDCTPWGHPDNEGYHTYRCCRFCDHMHYDVLESRDEDGTPYWEESWRDIREHFYDLVCDILHPEIDFDSYTDPFSRWTLSTGQFEPCVAHPDQSLHLVYAAGLNTFIRCRLCASSFTGNLLRGHNPKDFLSFRDWNSRQRFLRAYPRHLPEPISYEVAIALLQERDYDLTDPDRVQQVLGWFGDTENVRKAIAELGGA